MSEECCGNCRFVFSMTNYGRCRRFPPGVYYRPDRIVEGRPDSSFPKVRRDQWCGEWRSADKRGWFKRKHG